MYKMIVNTTAIIHPKIILENSLINFVNTSFFMNLI